MSEENQEELENIEESTPQSGFFPEPNPDRQTPTGEGDPSADQEVQTPTGEPISEQGDTTPAPTKVSLDDASLQALHQASQPQQPQPAEQQGFTDEQIQQNFKPVMLNKQNVANILGRDSIEDVTDEELASMQNFSNSIVQQAVYTADYVAQQKINQINQTIQPLHQAQVQQQERATKDTFYHNYPGLQQYEPIVTQAAQMLASEGVTGSDAQVFQHLANKTVDLCKTMNINVDLSQSNGSPTNQGAPSNQVPTMATMTSGGRSQSSGVMPTSSQSADTVFDHWRKKDVPAR